MPSFQYWDFVLPRLPARCSLAPHWRIRAECRRTYLSVKQAQSRTGRGAPRHAAPRAIAAATLEATTCRPTERGRRVAGQDANDPRLALRRESQRNGTKCTGFTDPRQ